MAPELLDNDELKADKSIDIYSLAVLFLEIITGNLKKRKHRFVIPKNFPESFNEMITSCLSENPRKRWTADEIVDKMARGEVILPDCNKIVFNKYVKSLKKRLRKVLKMEDDKNYSSDEEEEEEICKQKNLISRYK